jgi:hypothetical protein
MPDEIYRPDLTLRGKLPFARLAPAPIPAAGR